MSSTAVVIKLPDIMDNSGDPGKFKTLEDKQKFYTAQLFAAISPNIHKTVVFKDEIVANFNSLMLQSVLDMYQFIGGKKSCFARVGGSNMLSIMPVQSALEIDDNPMLPEVGNAFTTADFSFGPAPMDDLNVFMDPLYDPPIPLQQRVTNFVCPTTMDPAQIDPMAELMALAVNRDPGAVVTRPANSFMLYRNMEQEAMAMLFPNLSHLFISKLLGTKWQNETPENKAAYKDLAARYKEAHAVLYPGYRYTPRKSEEIKRRRGRDGVIKKTKAQRKVNKSSARDITGEADSPVDSDDQEYGDMFNWSIATY